MASRCLTSMSSRKFKVIHDSISRAWGTGSLPSRNVRDPSDGFQEDVHLLAHATHSYLPIETENSVRAGKIDSCPWPMARLRCCAHRGLVTAWPWRFCVFSSSLDRNRGPNCSWCLTSWEPRTCVTEERGKTRVNHSLRFFRRELDGWNRQSQRLQRFREAQLYQACPKIKVGVNVHRLARRQPQRLYLFI